MSDQEFYFNKSSLMVYKCISKTQTHFQLQRIGDGKVYQPSQNYMRSTYEPVPAPLITKIEQYSGLDNLKMSDIAGPDLFSTSKIGILSNCKEELSLDDLVLNSSIKKDLKLGLHKVVNAKKLSVDWGMNEIPGFKLGMSLNLYGPPGTGKTMAAKSIAKDLEKTLLIVDYSAIISKWVGDTGKNISLIFEEAKRLNAIIFFDEADSLLSKRVSLSGDSQSNSVNQNRNILMQEMDRFDGIILYATNFFGNYDEAINRRIAQHIEFNLPEKNQRLELFKLHIPSKTPKGRINYSELASMSGGLSGGDIKNICINSIFEASMGKVQKLTQKILKEQAEKVLKSKKTGKIKRGVVSLVS